MSTSDENDKERSTSPEQRGAFQAIKALQSVGGLQWTVIGWVLALIILINLISGWLQGIIDDWVGQGFSAFWDYCKEKPENFTSILLLVVVVTLFIAAVERLRRRAEKGIAERRPRVDDKAPAAPIAIIMFLSTPSLRAEFEVTENLLISPPRTESDPAKETQGNMDENNKNITEYQKIQRFTAFISTYIKFKPGKEHKKIVFPDSVFAKNATNTSQVGPQNETIPIEEDSKNNTSSLSDQVNVAYAKFNWRMNIESLKHYARDGGNLRDIIIIPSTDAQKSDGFDTDGNVKYKTFPGSCHWLAEAKHFIRLVLQNNGIAISDGHGPGIRLRGCGEIDLPAAAGSPPGSQMIRRLPEAIDYTNMEQLVDALYELNAAMRAEHRCAEQDILVDITSGTVMTSAAGMAFATLVKNRRVQYVNTNSHEVRTYDVTHEFDLPN